MDSTMLFAAFRTIQAGFPGTSAADMSWVLNAYTVVYAAMLIPAGGLADSHGRKRVFLLGVTLFLAASAACGLSGTVGWLIAARVAQAVGAAMLTPASLSILLDAFPLSKRSIAVSLWGAVSALAAAVGPSLGSFVIDTLGWEWAFYLNLPLGALSLWRGAALLKEAKRPENRRPVDGLGMGLLIFGVGALALSIVQWQSPNWSRAELSVAASLGLIALIGFVLWARATPAPLVDLRLFENRTYSFVNLATLAFGIAFSMMFFAFFFYMTEVWHYTLPQAGLAITPGPLLVIPFAVLSGRLAGRLGHRPFLVGGSLVYACAGLWFLLVPGETPAYLNQWLPGLLLSGMGVGLVLPSLSAAAVNRLPAAQYAVGSAVNQATRQIGSVMGVAVTVLLLGHIGLTHVSFVPVYGCHVALALLTALLCWPVNTRPHA
jgi:EmrB/QacA subfamily drug resistance transporter